MPSLVSSSNSFMSLAMPFCTKIKMNKYWWLLSFCRYKTFGAMPVQTELYIYSHSRSVQTHCILKLGRATPSKIETIGRWLRLESKDVPFVHSRDSLRASIHFRINPFLAAKNYGATAIERKRKVGSGDKIGCLDVAYSNSINKDTQRWPVPSFVWFINRSDN